MTTQTLQNRSLIKGLLLFVVVASLFSTVARATDSDTQQWTTLAFSFPDDDSRWSTGIWNQVRFSDDISYFNWLLINPSIHYRFDHGIKVGVGYQYIIKNDTADEKMPWQEVAHSHKFENRFAIGNRFRLENRINDEASGIVFRGRYRLSGSYQFVDSHYYLTSSNAYWWNLNEQGDEGPREGFDQNRLFGGLGVHLGEHWRAEAGYQWRYKNDKAGNADRNDHVIMLQFFYKTEVIDFY